MTLATDTFHINMFRSPPLLRAFFQGEDAIESLCRKTKSDYSNKEGKRNVLPIGAKAVFYELTACALKIIGLLAGCICCQNLSKRLIVHAKHVRARAETLRCEKIFKSNFLGPSINTYRKDSKNIYLSSYDNPHFLSKGLFNENGLCRGMSNWFYYLYFQTKQQFKDSRFHMKILTDQFAKGAPQQAALLHLLNPRLNVANRFLSITEHFLSLHIEEDFKRFSTKNLSDEQIADQFSRLPPGEYTVFTSSHQFNFIKENEHLSFLYDPSYGCFVIDKNLSLEHLLPKCLSSHDFNNEILIDRVSMPRKFLFEDVI